MGRRMNFFMLFVFMLLGFLLGDKIHPFHPCEKCPPCIEQAKAACPSEDIWVNTTYGLINFEKGEIDTNPPYILKKHDMDELYQKIEQEILKQKGSAL